MLKAEHIYRKPYVSHRLLLPARPIQDRIPGIAGPAHRSQGRSLDDDFAQQALDQLTREAASAIAAGADPCQVIRQMRL